MRLDVLNKISNPAEVKRRFEKYRGTTKAEISVSPRPDKKYMIRVAAADGNRGRIIHIGSTMPDFTKTADEVKRQSYLARSAGIRGDWKNDKYSANSLSRALMW